jgi:hypothetical protein
MSLKTTWENIHFERQNHFAWIFIEGRMFVINDVTYYKALKENYLNKQKYYEGTKIKKENFNNLNKQ